MDLPEQGGIRGICLRDDRGAKALDALDLFLGLGMGSPRKDRFGDLVSDSLNVAQIARSCLQDLLVANQRPPEAFSRDRGRRGAACSSAIKASVCVIDAGPYHSCEPDATPGLSEGKPSPSALQEFSRVIRPSLRRRLNGSRSDFPSHCNRGSGDNFLSRGQEVRPEDCCGEPGQVRQKCHR